MPEAVHFLQDLAIIMLTAAVAGLACRRIGLSPIVGYLLAGMIVGPLSLRYHLISNVERVQTLAELGLVFLMFGIGLSFSLRRLRQLGVGILVAALIEGFIIFTVARLVGAAFDLERAPAVFFAGMLVISSSAVIGKILNDAGRTHEKSSQLAFGVMLSEDIVAIVMLTLLGSYAHIGGHGGAGEAKPLLETLGLFGGFVLVLVTVGLLVIPRVLQRLSRDASAELETIFVTGLLLGLVLMVVRAGYSVALGAFLLGAIIGETPQRAHVERAFSGLHDLFGTIFFVAIGMSIDVTLLPKAIGPMLAITVLALIGRSFASATALLCIGHDTRTALRTCLILTPIGEFSFIVAQIGTESGILPREYMAAAVGASLITALVSPVLIRNNVAIAERLSSRPVPLISRLLAVHRRALDSLQRRSESNLLWRLVRKRAMQIGIEIGIVSAALIFARPIIDWIVASFREEIVPGVPTGMVCWIGLGLLLLAPLIAIWRNTQATAMILADFVARQSETMARSQAAITTVLQAAALIALLLWLWNFVPVEANLWMTVAVLALLTLIGALLWRRYVHWHSSMEITLESALATPDEGRPAYDWMDAHSPWGLQIGEVLLPDRFAWAGKSIGEVGVRKRFGCSVIGIERQGFNLANPGHAAHLFPGDRVLVVGTEEQINAVRSQIHAEHAPESREDTFRTLTLEVIDIPAGSPAQGRSLAHLNWPRLLGVQIVGHERDGRRILTPTGELTIETGDQLLALGTPQQLAALHRHVLPPQPDTPANAATGNTGQDRG